MRRRWFPLVCCLELFAVAGCKPPPTTPPAAEAPVVPVSRPVQRDVTDTVEYTGRTAAVQSLDVRARVSGYLVQMPFKEGSEVKAGELLFEIDPRPYKAQLDAAKAQVALGEANLKLARANNARARYTASKDPGSVTAQELDQYQAQEDQAAANLNVAKANQQTAQLNFDWTKVTSPIDGQVSRYYLTAGNLVLADQTLLTTVMSLEPMYAYFDMDDRTVLEIRKAINAGKIKPRAEGEIPVNLGLEGEEGYPHRGTVNFVNNTVNASTGTITVRGVFDNAKPPGGRRLLSPGMFVRIQLPLGQPHPANLVIDRAVGSDQGLKFLYVVDKENKVQYRRITTGALQEDGLRVIEEGLEPDDWVVVGALQQVRPRLTIVPEPMPMPTLGQPAGGEPPAERGKPMPPPAGGTTAPGRGETKR